MSIKIEQNFALADGTSVMLNVHAEYDAHKGLWPLQDNTYENSGGYIDGTLLFKGDRESAASYATRKKVCWNPNFARSLADTLIGHVFKHKIARSSESSNPDTTAFFDAADKAGKVTMNELMKKAHIYAFIHGHSFIVVDKPTTTAGSKLEESTNGMPYAYVVKATDVFDWYVDNDGVLVWIKIKETGMTNAEQPFGTYASELNVRTWTQNEWFLQNKDGDIIDTGEHKLGIVPVVMYKYRESVTYKDVGTTPFKDLSQVQLSLFNKISEQDCTLARQTFALLAIPGNKPKNQKAATGDTSDTKNNPDLTRSSMVYYSPESRHMPEFIQPDSTVTEAYSRAIALCTDSMKEIAKLKFTNGVMTSGVAMAFDFEATNTTLKESAKNLSEAEDAIFNIRAMWLGEKKSDVTVSYPEDFNLADLVQELKTIFDTLGLGLSERFNKVIKKRSARTLAPDASAEDLKIIDEEIEAGDDMMDIESHEEGEENGDDEEG